MTLKYQKICDKILARLMICLKRNYFILNVFGVLKVERLTSFRNPKWILNHPSKEGPLSHSLILKTYGGKLKKISGQLEKYILLREFLICWEPYLWIPNPYAHGDTDSGLEYLRNNRPWLEHPIRQLNGKRLHLTIDSYKWWVKGYFFCRLYIEQKLFESSHPRGPHLSFEALGRKGSSSTPKYPGTKWGIKNTQK